MNGENRGIVHPLRSHVEPIGTGGPLVSVYFCTQGAQKIINFKTVLFTVAEKTRRLRQALPNAAPQLGSGRFSESHDQNLRGVQAIVALGTAWHMPQNKPYVKCRECPGFPGSG